MPSVDFTDAEIEALYAVHTIAGRVNWAAYDQAKQRVIDAGQKHLESKEYDALNDLAAPRA